jgi:class 3 adenylate cyclase
LPHRHGSLAGAAMPSHRLRCRCASHRADAIGQELTGTARSLHGDPFGSPVRYASRWRSR